MKFENKS